VLVLVAEDLDFNFSISSFSSFCSRLINLTFFMCWSYHHRAMLVLLIIIIVISSFVTFWIVSFLSYLIFMLIFSTTNQQVLVVLQALLIPVDFIIIINLMIDHHQWQMGYQ